MTNRSHIILASYKVANLLLQKRDLFAFCLWPFQIEMLSSSRQIKSGKNFYSEF